MDKLKKVGLTALAGSMVASAAMAADASISAGWALSYTSADSDENSGTSAWSMGNSATISVSGDLDNGWTASASYELDDTYAGFDDQKLNLDMGEAGIITFAADAASGYGIDLVSNFVPNADTATYSIGFTDATQVSGANGTNGNLGYKLSIGDTGLTVGYEQAVSSSGGYDRSMAIKYSNADMGFDVGAGSSELNSDNGSGGDDETSFGAKVTMGGFVIGANQNKYDYGASTSNDVDVTHVGVSYAVNDDLTISYAQLTSEIATKSDDEVITQMSASYTMGSMSFGGYIAKQESTSGSAGSDDAAKHITMSLTF